MGIWVVVGAVTLKVKTINFNNIITMLHKLKKGPCLPPILPSSLPSLSTQSFSLPVPPSYLRGSEIRLGVDSFSEVIEEPCQGGTMLGL